MEQLFLQIQEVFLNLFHSEALIATLAKPEITIAAFVALNLIVFTETGLLIGFFLPGDSLLITAGIVAGTANWPLHWLILTLCVSAIVGDSVGYYIGSRAGPRLFTKEKSFLFRKDYLMAAQAFYEKHGGKTIILARFVPIIRTFAPVVAGIGKMSYSRFISFNVFGGMGWVVSMILAGFFLPTLLDPPLQRVFGPEFKVQKHMEKVIIIVVFLSVIPILYAGLRAWMAKGKIKIEQPAIPT
jgi:membrane-associated protein